MNNGPKRSENNKEVIVANIDLKDRYSNSLRGPKLSVKKSKIIRIIFYLVNLSAISFILVDLEPLTIIIGSSRGILFKCFNKSSLLMKILPLPE